MPNPSIAMQLMLIMETMECMGDLASTMADVSREMGFQHFALCHHIDVAAVGESALRLHNYPPDWVRYYDEHALGIIDPVRRACHVTSIGFPWEQMARMIPLTPKDRRLMTLGGAHGIGNGFTVPSYVPGEAFGSCSFALEADRSIRETVLPTAQLAGDFAFAAARRLWTRSRGRPLHRGQVPTDRQRECILWAALGKSNWAIGQILGISEATVARHLKQASARYGVNNRTSLAMRAILDGTITITELVRHGYAPFWA